MNKKGNKVNHTHSEYVLYSDVVCLIVFLIGLGLLYISVVYGLPGNTNLISWAGFGETVVILVGNCLCGYALLSWIWTER